MWLHEIIHVAGLELLPLVPSIQTLTHPFGSRLFTSMDLPFPGGDTANSRRDAHHVAEKDRVLVEVLFLEEVSVPGALAASEAR